MLGSQTIAKVKTLLKAMTLNGANMVRCLHFICW